MISPRSKRVLREEGIEEHRLYFITMKKYLNSHPEVKAASLEIQKKRYDHYEKRRLERIMNLKEKRNELIKAGSNTSSVELRKSQSCFNITSYLLKKEIDKLEQMKSHQLYEIKTLIDYEIQQSNLCKKSQEKQRQFQEKEELIRQQLNRERIEIKLRKRMEEKEREERLEKEELMNLRKKKKMEEEENEWKEEGNKQNKRLEREAQKRQLEQIRHQEELQKKIEQFLVKRNSYHIRKPKESEINDEHLNNCFDDKIENTKHSLMYHQIAQDKVYRTFIKNEEESMRKKLNFEEKQMKKEQLMIKYGEEIERKSQEQSVKMKIKQQKIINFSNINDKNTLKKIDMYYTKNEIAEKNRREREERSKEEFIKKMLQKRIKERDNYERKSQKDASLVLKQSLLLEKSYQAEEKAKMQREQLYRASINKFIEYASRYEKNTEKIEKNDKQLEFKNQLKIESFYNKDKKIEELFKQKNEITEKTKSCEKEINKRKKEIISNVNKLLKTGKVFSKEEMYQKVFTSEEYNTLSSRTMNQLRSGSCSPKMSLKYDITPSNVDNMEIIKLKKYNENQKYLNIKKYMSITPINETYKREMQLKNKGIENNDVLKDTKLFKTPLNDNDFFVTQNQFNSLGDVLKNKEC